MIYTNSTLYINIEDRINEDPLRMLRAVRFATVLGFRIEDNLYEEFVSKDGLTYKSRIESILIGLGFSKE